MARIANLIAIFLVAASCHNGASGGDPGPPEEGIPAAVSFLLGRQEGDGAWRSDRYPPLARGPSLTPLVLLALQRAREHTAEPRVAAAIERGTEYLASVAPAAGAGAEEDLSYPVYTAALTLRLVAELEGGVGAGESWLVLLRAHQLSEENGWQPADPGYGGWGYSHVAPRRGVPGDVFAAAADANLSATLFALDALRAAGVPASDFAYRRARIFVERCQNYAENPALGDDELDDGGFFFMVDDPARNKAGVVRLGEQMRFPSYGSTTADGLRALLAAGLDPSHPRVQAARSWLEERFTAERHPGSFTPHREPVRQAMYYYYAASLAQAFSLLGVATAAAGDWRQALAGALLVRQRADGSWSNPEVDVREDDPIVATAFALLALSYTQP